MSRNQRPEAWGRGGGGLVSRPESPRETVSRNRDFDGPRPAPNPPRLIQQPPAAQPNPRAAQGVGIAISRPAQVPQWPLITPSQAHSGPNDEFLIERKPAPQRPPRPSNVPSILDSSRIQDPTPSFQYRPQRESDPSATEDDTYSPNVTSPQTSTSRPSTVSSVGTIPDFPLPTPAPVTPVPARRNLNIRPPPSSRRGASLYYSNVFFASPIPEESPRTIQSHESYASSAAIPRDWEDDASDPYYDDDDADVASREGATPEEGRESAASNPDDSDERGLVRHASLGRRGRPLVVTTKGTDRKSSPSESDNSRKEASSAATETPVGTAIFLPSPNMITRDLIGNIESPLASGTGLIDRTPSSGSVPTTLGKNSMSTEEQPALPALSPVARDLLFNAVGNGGSPANFSRPERTGTRLSVRRPPRLDIDAVKEAESRGSLTSLPDLIRRATRLAAMIDRGKRPGSRLGLNDFSPHDSELGLEKEAGVNDRHQSGLSGMLAAFPPPGLTTPTPTRDIARDNANQRSSWPIPNEPPRNGRRREKLAGQGRRCQCCGMPAWVFLLILLSTLLIIAAAVIVPLELLVFKKSPVATSTASQSQSESQCQQNSTCANGGNNVFTDSTCICICANGFSGAVCTVPDVSGCTTTDVEDISSGMTFRNVTIGSSISRLLAEAQANFSISLSSQVILARFGAGNLSCSSENALVNFGGSSGRADVAQGKARRAGTNPDTIPASASSQGTPTTTISSASPTSSSNSIVSFVVTQEVLDFARVVVLYVLQRVNLAVAINVQTGIQSFFTENSLAVQTNEAAMNVSVGSGVTANFVKLNLDMGLGQGIEGGRRVKTIMTSTMTSDDGATTTTSSCAGCS